MRTLYRQHIAPKIITITGILFLPAIWLFLKEVIHVSDRYLPSIYNVFTAYNDIQPNIFSHLIATLIRILIGMSLGTIFGVFIGMFIYKWKRFYKLSFPSIQSLRAIPPIATVPFFLLWFGFEEVGKYLLITLGVGLNITITTFQILMSIPEKYLIFFKSFNRSPKQYIFIFLIPYIFENILPTLRFALATAIGLVIVSELLGAQIGIGYVLQVARSTFSLHVIFLSVILLGC
jgi:ABC-type nitrate/sulfonate/bicarbonate transport system permease component